MNFKKYLNEGIEKISFELLSPDEQKTIKEIKVSLIGNNLINKKIEEWVFWDNGYKIVDIPVKWDSVRLNKSTLQKLSKISNLDFAEGGRNSTGKTILSIGF